MDVPCCCHLTLCLHLKQPNSAEIQLFSWPMISELRFVVNLCGRQTTLEFFHLYLLSSHFNMFSQSTRSIRPRHAELYETYTPLHFHSPSDCDEFWLFLSKLLRSYLHESLDNRAKCSRVAAGCPRWNTSVTYFHCDSPEFDSRQNELSTNQ